MQNGTHLFGDGHFNSVAGRQSQRRVGCKHPFGDHSMHAGHDVTQLAATPQLNSNGPISRQSSRAGQYQVAHSRETRELIRAYTTTCVTGRREVECLRVPVI